MQRIDENTYIDDALVTCAEYQLFIDEMREQGKYYQPDHWTSYQFPAGQAHDPIFGVLHSDARIFCEWLTTRETREWSYRLPYQEEAQDFPLKPQVQSLLGYCYWVNDEYQFVWVGSAPKVALEIYEIYSPNGVIYFPAGVIDRTRDLNLNIDIERALDRAREIAPDDYRRLYLDILILQQRIAGRSPAVEGMRLVKERIR